MPNDQPSNGLTNGRRNGAHGPESESLPDPGLTTRQGHPVYDNQNNRTVGERGPTVLENYLFLEKISHFDRERIPERVVHARGAGAHGWFEAYGSLGDEPIAKFTRAKLFQEKGKRTPLLIRISTVIHGGHSPETLRDPRGFAVNFYTEGGNWDLRAPVSPGSREAAGAATLHPTVLYAGRTAPAFIQPGVSWNETGSGMPSSSSLARSH